MKTVFITVFQGVEFRNIIRTDIYKILVDSGVRLVLFTNSAVKRNYYQQEFNAPNIIYEVVENYQSFGLNRFFSALKFNLINTKTIDLKRAQDLNRDDGYFRYWFKFIFNRLFARRVFRRLVRYLDWRLVKDDFFSPYFEKYNPSLVLLAHLFGDIEVSFLRSARCRGVYTLGLINSWDKLTARCMMRFQPDSMIVHNEIMKSEAEKYADIPSKNIFVSGLPHFDFYVNSRRSERERFFNKVGLEPHERIILFCPAGTSKDLVDYLSKNKLPLHVSDPDTEMIILLDRLLSSGQLSSNLRLIVRFPPNDNVAVKENYPYKTKIIFQMPGRRFSLKRGQDWDMNENDFQELADTLYYSSVVISYPSTIVIDAAVFNRPIININIDFPNTPRGFLTWFYDVTHYQPVLRSGAVKLVNTEAELLEWLRFYLANPSADDQGRRRLVKWECGHLDGRAGKRVADLILSKI